MLVLVLVLALLRLLQLDFAKMTLLLGSFICVVVTLFWSAGYEDKQLKFAAYVKPPAEAASAVHPIL